MLETRSYECVFALFLTKGRVPVNHIDAEDSFLIVLTCPGQSYNAIVIIWKIGLSSYYYTVLLYIS